MNILYLRNDSINPDVRIEKEVKSLLNDGHSIRAYCCDRTGNEKKVETYHYQEGDFFIERKRIPYGYGGGFKKNIIPFLRFQFSIACFMFKNRKSYDVVHACDFNTAYTASVCCRVLKKPYIYDIFDYYVDCFDIPAKLRKTIEKMDHKVIRRAFNTIICSEERKNQINLGENLQYVIVHNSPDKKIIDNSEFKIKTNGKFKLAYVGGLSKKRKLDILANIVEKMPDVELHVAGYGELDDFFKDKVEHISNIKFYGKVQYSQALAIENQCNAIVAIYPLDNKNHKYAAPNKFYEGLMMGKPLFMIKGSGMSGIVGKNGFGILIDFNEQGIIDGIEALKTIDINVIENKMKLIFEEEYQWSIMGERVKNIYRELKNSMKH